MAIETLNGVGSIDDFPQLARILEIGAEARPVCIPGLHGLVVSCPRVPPIAPIRLVQPTRPWQRIALEVGLKRLDIMQDMFKPFSSLLSNHPVSLFHLSYYLFHQWYIVCKKIHD